ATPKRVFVAALDWPGWVRGGKDEGLAVEALLAAAPRIAGVAAGAGLAFDPATLDLEVVERLPGGSGTEFGVPSSIAEADRTPLDAVEAARLAAIVEAAWTAFDRVAAAAPEELRKGPRGGGRDRTKIVGHVNEADAAYARELGLTSRPTEVPALRAAMLEVLGTPSDGSPLAGRRWTQRYAARRIAWHALDHAWEIEDRTEH
ncbi:MAG: hypothetical protein A2V85_00685, partial [Chloroflexi bacterium RBG_16_72_14]